jgi:uncharacterized RDD family membrane protein YckC
MWINETWAEARETLKAVLIDVLLFLVVLIALAIGFIVLRGLRFAGFPEDRVLILETLHYWGYVAVFAIFLCDLLFKLILGTFMGARKRLASDKIPAVVRRED